MDGTVLFSTVEECRNVQTENKYSRLYLLDYNTCLEVQGQQHYDINHCWYRPEYDERKREYCNKNGIKLIEIPYYDYKNFSFDYLKQKMEN